MKSLHIFAIAVFSMIVFEFILFFPQDIEIDELIYLSSTKVSLINTTIETIDSLEVNPGNDAKPNASPSATLKTIHAPYIDADAKNARVTSSYYSGFHKSIGQQTHKALDFGTGGTAAGIAAVWDGVVEFAGWSGNGYGELCVIRHNVDGKTVFSKYNHLAEGSTAKYVKVGDKVIAGQRIGTQGGSGGNYDVHLDFQMAIFEGAYNYKKFRANLINPAAIYKGWVSNLDEISKFNGDTCTYKGKDYDYTKVQDINNGEYWWK